MGEQFVGTGGMVPAAGVCPSSAGWDDVSAAWTSDDDDDRYGSGNDDDNVQRETIAFTELLI